MMLARRMNWLILVLVTGGLVVLALNRAAGDPVFDHSILYGIAPYLIAQMAYYHPNRKSLKWFAVTAVSIVLLAIAMGVLLAFTSLQAESIKWGMAIVCLSAIPLLVNLVTLLHASVY